MGEAVDHEGMHSEELSGNSEVWFQVFAWGTQITK